jgi:hypothetical protein
MLGYSVSVSVSSFPSGVDTMFQVSDSIVSPAGFPIVTIDEKPFPVKRLLQSGDSNTKLRKNSGAGFQTVGLSLAPHQSAGIGNVCPWASNGCIEACLNHQGLASVFHDIQRARIAKTVAWYENRQWFLDTLKLELEQASRRAAAAGQRIAARLNVFSDIPWETTGIIDAFPKIEFYDYSKAPRRAGLLRPNYWVTLSRSETNSDACIDALSRGANVAIPFADSERPYVGNRAQLQQLPKKWYGFHVIDGDTTDLRFDDIRGRKHGRVVGLRLKAHSHNERKQAIASGFAIEF